MREVSLGSIRWSNPNGLTHALRSAWTEGTMATDNGHRAVLVEFRVPFAGGHSPHRLDTLCELLQATYLAGREEDTADPEAGRTADFATLECVGWTDTSSMPASLPRIGLVFRCPSMRDNIAPSPQTLRHRLKASRSVGAPVPVLGERFDLACGVASAVANIISIGWSKYEVFLRNFRSRENASVFVVAASCLLAASTRDG